MLREKVSMAVFRELKGLVTPMEKITQTVETLLQLIESDIKAHKLEFSKESSNLDCLAALAEAYQYPLLAGGKRIRPLLLLLCAGAIGGEKAVHQARQAALAIECVHTYSLVHDDLPCMDNDDLRRGRPTTHKVYGEAKGLLIGDALLTEAFHILATIPCKKTEYLQALVQELSLCSGAKGMVMGQWLDISLTGKTQLSWHDIEQIHRNKTGKLLGCCFALGSICALNTLNTEISSADLQKFKATMKSVGELVGVSFQIIDDILDATQNSHTLGKTAGKDLEQQKFTAVSLLGIKEAELLAQQLTSQAYTLLTTMLNSSNHLNSNEETDLFRKALFAQLEQLLARMK